MIEGVVDRFRSERVDNSALRTFKFVLGASPLVQLAKRTFDPGRDVAAKSASTGLSGRVSCFRVAAWPYKIEEVFDVVANAPGTQDVPRLSELCCRCFG